MKGTFLLHFDETDQHLACLFIDDYGVPNFNVRLEQIPSHLDINPNYQIILLAPNQEISFIEINANEKPKSRNLYNFIFETTKIKLPGNKDDWHLSLSENSRENKFIIAAVRHEKMQQWLSQLTPFNVYPNIITPDVLSLPRPETGWSLLQLANRVLVRINKQMGFTAISNELSNTIRSYFDSQTESFPEIHEVKESTQEDEHIHFDLIVMDQLKKHSDTIYSECPHYFQQKFRRHYTLKPITRSLSKKLATKRFH